MKNKKMCNSVLELIGHTPLVELKRFVSTANVKLFAKLEFYNPTLSIKDRIVAFMLDQMEASGVLKPGNTVVEASSGNTGAALAMIGAMRHYKVIITTPQKTSNEKVQTMRAFGAEVIICPPVSATNPEYYVNKAKSVVASIPGAQLLNQYESSVNSQSHYETIAPELWDQLDGQIDYLVCGGSTGGTISGVGRFLKQQHRNVQVIMADPEGSCYFDYFKTGSINQDHVKPYKIEGVGKDYICGVMDFSVVDDVIQFSDADAILALKKVAITEGLLVGGSSGGALHVAQLLATQLQAQGKRGNIVVILPDSGFKYLSKLFA